MVTQRRPPRIASAALAEAGFAFAAGLVFGGLTSLTAFLLARYGPSGGDWSFRGNGALAAYSLIPPLLAGGWTAIVLYNRGRAWAPLGAMATVVGIGLAALDATLLPVFGPGADQTLGPIALITLAVWTGAAPVLAARLPRRKSAGSTLGVSMVSAVTFAAALAGGVILVATLIPAGS